MPSASLPTTPKGWIVGMAAALVGLMAGLLTIRLLSGLLT